MKSPFTAAVPTSCNLIRPVAAATQSKHQEAQSEQTFQIARGISVSVMDGVTTSG